jgi:hypothetical protein
VSAPQLKGQQQAFLETLNLVDAELCYLKEGSQIPFLFSKPKSLIISDLFSTVKTVKKRILMPSISPAGSYAGVVHTGL